MPNRKRLQPEIWSIFVEDIARGACRLGHLTTDDLIRLAELETAYSDLDLGWVGASVITVMTTRLSADGVAHTIIRGVHGLVGFFVAASLQPIPARTTDARRYLRRLI